MLLELPSHELAHLARADDESALLVLGLAPAIGARRRASGRHQDERGRPEGRDLGELGIGETRDARAEKQQP